MKTVIPPLKSQGIKTKLVPLIADLLPDYSGNWIEPFLGTGVVAFNLAHNKAQLNDLNPHLINFYRDIQDGKVTPSRVKDYLVEQSDFLLNSDLGKDSYYYEVRKRFNHSPSSLDLLFLSRAGFNGMMRFSKKGHWNIPFCKKPQRFQQAYVTKIVNQVAAVTHKMKKGWVFSNGDFSSLIENATESDLIYCDPPYYGRHTDYYNSWSEEDEYRLFELLDSTRAKFIISTWHHNRFRANPMISKLWSRYNMVTREHFYHTGARIENRHAMTEALIMNYEPPKKPISPTDIELQEFSIPQIKPLFELEIR
ncbi:MAG: Dam family site-specific DNA-(adenine-N6)-methyltransferase [Candidatus Pacebacteria bacterium]|nr:Dam family site-specific DNA-(adenine-N6)-methyltransferase [Candidatus Paceibacterota bacterium]